MSQHRRVVVAVLDHRAEPLHGGMSQEQRDRVRAAMQDLDYQPSAVARSLRSQGSGSVG